MNLRDWIVELCDTLDLDADVDEGLVLDVAKTVATHVERPAAPISAYLLGIAVGRAAADADQREQLAAAVQSLAERWDRSGDGAPAKRDADDLQA